MQKLMVYTNAFKREMKKMMKRFKDFKKLEEVLSFLVIGKTLPAKYKNHKLKGLFSECWECHLEPDWLLIYRVSERSIEVL